MGQSLAEIFAAAARGVFPPADGGTTVMQQPTPATPACSPSRRTRSSSWTRTPEIADPDHPRVRAHRDDVRAWTTDGGVLVLGRGVAGRWETAIEVDEPARHRGLGRALATAARHLVPYGGHLWSQQAAGNARSIRAFQAAGFRPVASEILLSRKAAA